MLDVREGVVPKRLHAVNGHVGAVKYPDSGVHRNTKFRPPGSAIGHPIGCDFRPHLGFAVLFALSTAHVIDLSLWP